MMDKPKGLTRITRKSNGAGNIQPLTQRFGTFPKGTVLPETIQPRCPKRKVSDFPPGFLKQKHIEHLEHNQRISSCCRHPENHSIEAFKSHPAEPHADIYVFHCTCGRKHRFFCMGLEDEAREWDVITTSRNDLIGLAIRCGLSKIPDDWS